MHPAILVPLLCRVVLCTCLKGNDPRAAVPHFVVVFSGRVVSLDTSEVLPSPAFPDYHVTLARARFIPDAIWKGAPADTVDLFFGAREHVCDYEFRLGVRYVVFAAASGPRLVADVCSPTAAEPEADSTIAVLGPPVWQREAR